MADKDGDDGVAMIVAALIQKGEVGLENLDETIASVRESLRVGKGGSEATVTTADHATDGAAPMVGDWARRLRPIPDDLTPAVPRERSVYFDHIVGLEDGEHAKILKHYVKRHGMTLDGYYQRWGLPPDYPKQCASVSQRKREIAEKTGLGQVRRKPAGASETRPEPAVPIDQSVTDDYIICLEDGQKVKGLKRHLKAHHNMSFEEYQEKWGLPDDYPKIIVPKSMQKVR